jgi:hypothetical protein
MATRSDYAVTSIETITAFDITTGNYLFTLDELQNATISQSEDKTDITGKAGRKLTSLKRNKAVTISATNGLISSGLLEVQTGSSFQTTKTLVQWKDDLTVADNKATTEWKAAGSAGSEITVIYVRNSDGTLGDKLTQNTEVGTGTFTYDPETKTLAFDEGELSDGTEIVVYYYRYVEADVHTNMSDNYSTKCNLYVDVFMEDKCANIFRGQFHFPKADVSGDFSIEMGESQSVHAFEAESLAGACGSNNSSALWTYTIFGANSTDAEGGNTDDGDDDYEWDNM